MKSTKTNPEQKDGQNEALAAKMMAEFQRVMPEAPADLRATLAPLEDAPGFRPFDLATFAAWTSKQRPGTPTYLAAAFVFAVLVQQSKGAVKIPPGTLPAAQVKKAVAFLAEVDRQAKAAG
jgi:hypothetical protein